MALSWTVFVTVLCLVSFKGVSVGNVMSHDKMGHGIFHFVMASVWFLFFRFRKEWEFRNAVLSAFLFSLLYGIAIEFMQHYFTDTRSADIEDVYANATGALLAVVVLILARLRRLAVERA